MSFGKLVDLLELDELGIVIAEAVLRLDVHGDRVAGLLEIERLFELRQHARMSRRADR
jgi:hypothetical protein